MRKVSCSTFSALVAAATCLFFIPGSAVRAEDSPTPQPLPELKSNEIALYDHEDFKEKGSRVKHIIVTETTADTVNNLTDLIMNDCISSMRWNLEPGIEVTFFEHGDGRGREYKISGKGEVISLKGDNFSNVASSFRWTRTESKEAK